MDCADVMHSRQLRLGPPLPSGAVSTASGCCSRASEPEPSCGERGMGSEGQDEEAGLASARQRGARICFDRA